jgi:hypothetical protein
LVGNLRVVRSRTFFNHSSPWEQAITEELTIYNEDASKSHRLLIIPLPEFREGLRVLDFDNSELAFLPRDLMEKEILLLKEADNDSYVKMMDDLEKGHLLWIVIVIIISVPLPSDGH